MLSGVRSCALRRRQRSAELDNWCSGSVDVEVGDGSFGPPGSFAYAEQAGGGPA